MGTKLVKNEEGNESYRIEMDGVSTDENKPLHERIEEATRRTKRQEYVAFSGCDTSVTIGDQKRGDIESFSIYTRRGLSQEDFFKTIPQLNGASLKSVLNCDVVFVISNIIMEKDLEVPEGCDITLTLANEFGNVRQCVLSDAHQLYEKTSVSLDTLYIVQTHVIACGAISAFKIAEDIN